MQLDHKTREALVQRGKCHKCLLPHFRAIHDALNRAMEDISGSTPEDGQITQALLIAVYLAHEGSGMLSRLIKEGDIDPAVVMQLPRQAQLIADAVCRLSCDNHREYVVVPAGDSELAGSYLLVTAPNREAAIEHVAQEYGDQVGDAAIYDTLEAAGIDNETLVPFYGYLKPPAPARED